MRLIWLILLLFSSLLLGVLNSSAEEELKVIVFRIRGCSACERALKLLEHMLPNASIECLDVENYDNALLLAEIYKLLIELEEGPLPVIIFVLGKKVRGIAIGDLSLEEWKNVLSILHNESAPPFLAYAGPLSFFGCPHCRAAREVRTLVYIPQSKALALKRTLLAGDLIRHYMEPLWALTLVITAALADSINPCLFTLYATMLLLMSLQLSLRSLLLSGISFILAVFMTYYLLGLGVITAIPKMRPLLRIFPIIVICLGARSLLAALRGEIYTPLPKALRKLMRRSLSQASLMGINAASSSLLGLICGLGLLPCTAGPYLVAAVAIRTFKSLAIRLALLALYNLLVVAPLLIMLMVTSAARERISRLRNRKTRLFLEVINGSLLVLVGIIGVIGMTL